MDQLFICVLALRDTRAGSVRRAYLDPSRSADGRILELLRRDFHATVVVYGDKRTLLRSFRVEAPRSANVDLILRRTERAPEPSPECWAQAVAACRLTPPPLGEVEHPFRLEDDAPSAAEALRRLRRLEAWGTPDRVEEALTILSVPRRVFELSRRRIVGDALRFGLAMSSGLLLEAVRFGFASDTASLVLALRRQFDQIVPSAPAQGLDEAQIQANVQALERLCRVHGTSTRRAASCTMEHSG